MKRKMLLNTVLVAFVALTAAATTCYYYAWPNCPQYPPLGDPEWCPDNLGGLVSYCESAGDSYGSYATSGAPNDSRYCGKKWFNWPCAYECYWYVGGNYEGCGYMTNNIADEVPDPSSGFCPNQCAP